MWLSGQRKMLGLTQIELANASGVSHSSISKIEIGVHGPSARNLRKLASGLRVTLPQIQAAARGEAVKIGEQAPGPSAALPADVAARLESLGQRMSIPAEELLRIACDVLERVYRR